MSYPEQMMQSEEPRYPSSRFFLLLLAMGAGIGATLLVLQAPFWLFYAASVLMVPIVIWELRHLELARLEIDDAPAQSAFTQIAQRWKARIGEHWLVEGLGLVWALVATVGFVRDAPLVGGMATATSAALLGYAVWQLSRTKTILDLASASRRRELILHLADELMKPPDISAAIVEWQAHWLLLPKDRDAEEEVPVFDSEDEAREAGETYIAEHGGELLTLVMEAELKRELMRLQGEEEHEGDA